MRKIAVEGHRGEQPPPFSGPDGLAIHSPGLTQIGVGGFTENKDEDEQQRASKAAPVEDQTRPGQVSPPNRVRVFGFVLTKRPNGSLAVGPLHH